MSSKGKKRGRPKGAKNQLSALSIMECAKYLLLTQGKVPSIRQIANALNVDAMAIYHYYSNKSALLEAVTVSLIEKIYEPSGKNDWQVELELLCKSYLKLLGDHAGLLETILTMSSEGPAAVFTKRFYIAVAPLNLDKGKLKDGLDFLADYLHGFAFTMNCNPQNEQLSIDLIDGPLSLYKRALILENSQPSL